MPIAAVWIIIVVEPESDRGLIAAPLHVATAPAWSADLCTHSVIQYCVEGASIDAGTASVAWASVDSEREGQQDGPPAGLYEQDLILHGPISRFFALARHMQIISQAN